MGGCFFIGTRENFPDKSVKNWQNFFFTKVDLEEHPTQSASARGGTAPGQRGEGSIEVFGGCLSVPLRVRDTVWKYAGDRKTEGL